MIASPPTTGHAAELAVQPSGGAVPLKPLNRTILSPGLVGLGSHGASTPSPSVSGVLGGLAIGHASHSSPKPSPSSSNAPPATCSHLSMPLGMPSPSRSPSAEMHTAPPGAVRSQTWPLLHGVCASQASPLVVPVPPPHAVIARTNRET